ncbi:recombinase family protein [Neobacillus niacini]|uniref:recombinase family protein n=1 Tax=Neobacillus niacini TaxID=86668 RepID=UPI0021CAE46E|nr:recombinase family protein [Neobacillus niacini]MCM3768383.1 recombinase family protein [Neobacillus niacini]
MKELNLDKILFPGAKVAFYGRHSTDKQNMETQLQSAYNLAEKYNCEVVEEYLDPAISSRNKNREGLERLIKDAHFKKFESIIIYDHGRLARMPEEHDTFRMVMSALGIHVVESRTETLYNYGDVVISAIKDGIAKYELDKLRINTKNAIETLFNNGCWTGAKTPFGYEYNKIKEVINTISHELSLVKSIFSLYKKGEGFYSIAKKMPKGSYRGKDWDKYKVKHIILNPFYAGYNSIRRWDLSSSRKLNPREEWKMKKDEKIDAIISLEEWEYCWDLYTKKKAKEITPRKYYTSFLLKDILSCKHCGSFLKGKDQRSKGYGSRIYRCLSCNIRINSELLEEKVKELVKDFRKKNPNDKLLQSIVADIQTEISLHEDLLKSIQQDINNNKIKLQKYDFRINEEFKKETHNNELLKALVLGKEDIAKKIQQMSEEEKRLTKKIKFSKEISLYPENLKHEISIFENEQKVAHQDFRKLFLFMIHELRVNQVGELEITFNFNIAS